MNNYPDGMTPSDWKYIAGDDITRSCYQCGSSVPIKNGSWGDECHLCGTVLEAIDDSPDPDYARDRQKELGNE